MLLRKISRLGKTLANENVSCTKYQWVLSTFIQTSKYSSKSLKTSLSPETESRIQSKENERDLEQVTVPELEFNGSNIAFKGLETDFPCLLKHSKPGPDPEYQNVNFGYKLFHSTETFSLKYNNAVLPEMEIAYETWGELNTAKDNAILISCGLSANSHARSHPENVAPGWWEKFIGPGCAIDTDKFFVICYNNLGGCHGSSGPSSINPQTKKHYATTFPIISVDDIVKSAHMLLDHLGIDKVYAHVGSSLGGCLSITSAVHAPHRVGRVVSISGSLRAHPKAIALRYLQRKNIMLDPNWQKGYYYNTGKFPRTGTKLAREIATLTYRGGDEWDTRFGRHRISDTETPSLCPYFMIENYLDYQGESFIGKIDPNTLLYISKAMDLFDIGESYASIDEAVRNVTCPVMVVGVHSDMLFPIEQQREMANALRDSGNNKVTFYELSSPYGHDTFLLDLNNVGAAMKGFLETEMALNVK